MQAAHREPRPVSVSLLESVATGRSRFRGCLHDDWLKWPRVVRTAVYRPRRLEMGELTRRKDT